MPIEDHQYLLFMASPGDFALESAAVPKVIQSLRHEYRGRKGLKIEYDFVDSDSVQSFTNLSDHVIDSDVDKYEVSVTVFWCTIGQYGEEVSPGSVGDFLTAFKKLKSGERPKLLFFLNNTPVLPSRIAPQSIQGLEQARKTVLDLGGKYLEYKTPKEFRDKLFDTLWNQIAASPIGFRTDGPTGPEISLFKMIREKDAGKLKVPDHDFGYSSFKIEKESSEFLCVFVQTTSGVVKEKRIENRIHLIEDPIRPYTIQIGASRPNRKKGHPDTIPDLADLNFDQVRTMYPFIMSADFLWLRMVLAELATDKKTLKLLAADKKKKVRKVVANNPAASRKMQKSECLFCKPGFRTKRRDRRGSTEDTVIFANDFPYGPYFHYIAMPDAAVHSWEDITEEQLTDMNLAIWDFLRRGFAAKRLEGPGVHIGLNSSIRHLVIGRRTRSSAGASIAHVHKQFWGMSPTAFGLGDYLATVIEKVHQSTKGADYLERYLDSLKRARLVLWHDDNVALYIPIGQISLHELQIMVKEPTSTYLDLTEEQVRSLSKAEYYVTQIYQRIGITSFNEILITERLGKNTPRFRLILTFITREVDLAVSELNNLFVMDEFPNDSQREILRNWSPPDSGNR